MVKERYGYPSVGKEIVLLQGPCPLSDSVVLSIYQQCFFFRQWLDQFEMFSIYEVLPEILELWGSNMITDIESKKNRNRVLAK